MNLFWLKLGIDLCINWWQQNRRSWSYWLALCLLAVPLAFFIQAHFIKQTYSTPFFLGVDKPSGVNQVRYFQGETGAALPFHLSKERVPNLNYQVVYEKSQWLSGKLPETVELNASFFSGGYSHIGLAAAQGSLQRLEFPNSDSQIHVAISDQFWQRQFKKKNILGQSFVVNNQVVVIDAVMPQSFKGLRKGHQVDVIVPFAFLQKMTGVSFEDLPPDVYSYLLSNSELSQIQMDNATRYFRDEVLIFDDDTLILADVFGIGFEQYNYLTERLQRLTLLFIVLLLFSFFAFLSHQVNNNQSRQNEATLRQLVGANRLQLSFQQLLENSLTFAMLFFLVLLFSPSIQALVSLIIPNLSDANSIPLLDILKIAAYTLIILVVCMPLIFSIQQRLFSSSLGRGQTITLGQKLQTYIILSLMVGLSSLSLIRGGELLEKQYQYYKKERGYNYEGLYIARFAMPKFGGTFYANDLPRLLLTTLEQQQVVDGVALTELPFLIGRTSYSRMYTPTMQPLGGGNKPMVLSTSISPNFFDVTGIELIKGHSLSWGAHRQAIISESIYKQFFKGESLSNVSILVENSNGGTFSLDVVGVAKDVHLNSVDEKPQHLVYKLSLALTGFESLIVQSKATEKQILSAVRFAAESLDSSLNRPSLHSVEKLIKKQEAPQLALLTMSLVVMVTLLVSTILFCLNGIQLMLKKTEREIALRLSMGAMPKDIALGECLRYLVVSTPILVTTCILIVRIWPQMFASLFVFLLLFAMLSLLSALAVFLVIYFGVRLIKTRSWSLLT